jgi:hypothetical protein
MPFKCIRNGNLSLTQLNNLPTISVIYAVPPSSPIVNIDFHQKNEEVLEDWLEQGLLYKLCLPYQTLSHDMGKKNRQPMKHPMALVLLLENIW